MKLLDLYITYITKSLGINIYTKKNTTRYLDIKYY
jgi:hypothetical protein